jgi:2-polyprenyl-6-methoxyphenol hydroxylase-like FAD-dependent oxidoreductase
MLEHLATGGAMEAQVVIVGAGPAGALLAYLLSSRGIETLLIERQTDFSREFRGEVLVPSGIRALQEAGFPLEPISTSVPDTFEGYLNGRCFIKLDEMELGPIRPTAVSQPEMLESLVALSEETGAFQLLRGRTVRGLIRDYDGGISLRMATRGSDREETIRAPFVIGADGRSSIIRKRLGRRVRKKSVPLDIVWFKLPYPESWNDSRFRFEIGRGHLLIAIRAPDGLLQVAWVILKGTYGDLRARGIDEWITAMSMHADPELADHLIGNRDRFSRPFLLDTVTDRVLGWSTPNTLLIGDAAHAMSPVGAQGLNLALRDAIVTANVLVPAFRGNADLDQAAARVEALRGPEIDRIQRLAAFPPRLVMGRTRLHDAARHLIPRLANSRFARARAGRLASIFMDGVTTVQLTV